MWLRPPVIGVLALTVASTAEAQQRPAIELFMNSKVGTAAVAALPQFADGKLYGCLLEFNNIPRDAIYRQGGFIKVFGSFGVVEAKGNLAVTLKIVVQDIDLKTAAFTPSAPANSYFVFGTQTSKADLVAKYPSDI